MYKKLLLRVFFIGIFMMMFTSKAYAMWEGIGADFSDPDGNGAVTVVVSNDESQHPKGQNLNVQLTVYQCYEAAGEWCAGNSSDFKIRDNTTFSITLPGSGDGDVQLSQTASIARYNKCGRFQLDLVPFPEIAVNIGGETFPMSSDCPAPTVAPTQIPTLTPTPIPICSSTSYNQCGDIICNGVTYNPRHTVSVVKKVCGLNTTYVCTDLGAKSGECNPGPTPTPTQIITGTPPPPTPTPTGQPSVTPTPTGQPSPTPTQPPFNSQACKCDGLTTNTGIVLGYPAVFSAFAKVDASDVNKAQVTGMTFRFMKNDPNILNKNLFNLIQPPGIVTVPVQLVAPRVAGTERYLANWTLAIPKELQQNTIYRVFAQPVCVPKVGQTLAKADNLSQKVVLGDFVSKEKGIFDTLTAFVKDMIGGVKYLALARPNLQLQPFYPAKIITKDIDRCTILDFQFSTP